MLSDFIVTLRQLQRTPVQTTIAILTLAIGIGLSTTMGSLLNALVLDPFNYPQPDRIVQLCNVPGWPLSGSDYEDLRDQSTSYETFGAYTMNRYSIGGATPVGAFGAPCTSGVLRTLGVNPQLGRLLLPEDDLPGSAAVAVISHGLWQRAFGGDTGIIGKHVPVNGRDTEIVGVMPAGFEFLVAWFNQTIRDECSIWTQIQTAPWYGSWSNRSAHCYMGIARLKVSVSPRAADAETKAIALRLAQAHPGTNKEKPFTVRTLRTELTEGINGVLPGTGSTWMLFGASVIVLLVACTNVACMLIAQGTARQREFTIRLAVGASRWAVVRLLLIESFILASAGAVLGLLAAWWGISVLAYFAPVPSGRESAVQMDGVLVLLAVALVFLSTIVMGLLTAFAARDTNAANVLRAGGRGQAGSRGRQQLLRTLIIGQVAVALVLANTATVFTNSYQKVLSANRGMDTTRVLTGSLTLQGERYAKAGAQGRFVDQMLERVRGLPGVTDAGVTSKLPLEGGNNGNIYVGEPGSLRRLDMPAENSWASTGYFTTTGLALLKGRLFTTQDNNAKPTNVVVNRTLADKAWPDKNPVGKEIFRSTKGTSGTGDVVIGVVENVNQQGADNPTLPEIYYPYAKNSDGQLFLLVRSSQDARPLGKLLQREISAIDPELPLGTLRTLQDILTKSTHQRRFIATMMGLFTLCVMTLAMVGIYGTLSYYVAERTQEFGIRMALGAVRSNVVKIVLRRVGVWLGLGAVLGVGAIFGVARVLRSMLYEMEPVSAPVLIASVAVVLLTGLVAGLIPALRATKIEPLEALRAE